MLEQYVIVTNEDCECFNIWNQAFTEEMMREEFESAGFGKLEFYGDVTGKEVRDEDETVCVVAR